MARTACHTCGRAMERRGLFGHLLWWHKRAWLHLETCREFQEELGFGTDGETVGDEEGDEGA